MIGSDAVCKKFRYAAQQQAAVYKKLKCADDLDC